MRAFTPYTHRTATYTGQSSLSPVPQPAPPPSNNSQQRSTPSLHNTAPSRTLQSAEQDVRSGDCWSYCHGSYDASDNLREVGGLPLMLALPSSRVQWGSVVDLFQAPLESLSERASEKVAGDIDVTGRGLSPRGRSLRLCILHSVTSFDTIRTGDRSPVTGAKVGVPHFDSDRGAS
ncbi:hypothetical protein BGW36DRAFT_424866 [Talaromyces proteolyticus]|uniref:Uncharacterized protein n=1 Tax=Talaromyces proteolyticus TaxID=1131652 RepID=A0AAD4KWS5_9EURO|nr:uncharacterized protein BGW36DRAFT_424866 [Talaromyces proteolyticus]KAH8702597.1 hypothetical protein BGW36DRAFT_424866 [Talaromyces proteolyticus]